MGELILFKVGNLADFPFGARRMFQTHLENILVVNAGGDFFAVSNTCPHAGAYLNYGILEDYIIECPLHYWPFDLRTGCLVGMETGWQEGKLETYRVVIKGEEIFIELPLETGSVEVPE